MEQKDYTIHTSKEMLVSNPNSSYTVWYGIDDRLLEYVQAIKKEQHVMLLVLESKSDWKKIGGVLEKMKMHYPIVLKYETEKKDSIRSVAQVGLLLTSQNYSLDFQKCSWYDCEVGYPTNLWPLSPNRNFETSDGRFHLGEGLESIPYGHASFDVFILLHQLSTPLPRLRWTYVGPRNSSVLRYSANVLPCNVCFT